MELQPYPKPDSKTHTYTHTDTPPIQRYFRQRKTNRSVLLFRYVLVHFASIILFLEVLWVALTQTEVGTRRLALHSPARILRVKNQNTETNEFKGKPTKDTIKTFVTIFFEIVDVFIFTPFVIILNFHAVNFCVEDIQPGRWPAGSQPNIWRHVLFFSTQLFSEYHSHFVILLLGFEFMFLGIFLGEEAFLLLGSKTKKVQESTLRLWPNIVNWLLKQNWKSLS